MWRKKIPARAFIDTLRTEAEQREDGSQRDGARIKGWGTQGAW